MAQHNQQYLNEYNNPHSQVRQNLINDQNPPEDQIPIEQILAPPVVHPPVQYNIMMDIPLQQTVIPLVPISRYKFPLEIWFLVGCLIEIVFFEYNCIHVIWAVWYILVGFWRHGIIRRNLRFWGEFSNIMIWIMTNCYVFSGHGGTMFPFAIIIQNMDYYFNGGHLSSIYCSYFTYVSRQWYADLKLYIIRRKLEERRKVLIENEMHRFVQNEVNHSRGVKQMQIGTQESVEENMIREQTSSKQKQIGNVHGQNECLLCMQELVQGRDRMQRQTVRLQCHHKYHYSCLKKFMQQGNGHCPVCRKFFVD